VCENNSDCAVGNIRVDDLMLTFDCALPQSVVESQVKAARFGVLFVGYARTLIAL
jgi:hypothetical protein